MGISRYNICIRQHAIQQRFSPLIIERDNSAHLLLVLFTWNTFLFLINLDLYWQNIFRINILSFFTLNLVIYYIYLLYLLFKDNISVSYTKYQITCWKIKNSFKIFQMLYIYLLFENGSLNKKHNMQTVHQMLVFKDCIEFFFFLFSPKHHCTNPYMYNKTNV